MVQDSVSVTVTRASETWQFFAFVFASIAALGLAVFDDLWPRPGWQRIAWKLAMFLVFFYLFMKNTWTRNHLVQFLAQVKTEHIESTAPATPVVKPEDSPPSQADTTLNDENVRIQRKLASFTKWLVV